MKEYDTSTHDTPVTVERNTDECCCVKHCKGYTMNWYNVVCKECYSETIRRISQIK